MEPQPILRRRVLIVEDQPAVRAVLEFQFRAAGYEVVVAEDAPAARRLLYEAQPQVMIVDAQMPCLRGMAFVAELIAEPALPWVPVVFVTEPVEALLALVERVLTGEPRGRDSEASVQLPAA